MTVEDTGINNKHVSNAFPIIRGLKQDHSLFPLAVFRCIIKFDA
jgi:hypothetical protein